MKVLSDDVLALPSCSTDEIMLINWKTGLC